MTSPNQDVIKNLDVFGGKILQHPMLTLQNLTLNSQLLASDLRTRVLTRFRTHTRT